MWDLCSQKLPYAWPDHFPDPFPKFSVVEVLANKSPCKALVNVGFWKFSSPLGQPEFERKCS